MAESMGIILWLVLMVLALPYVWRARHPRAQTLAAYMIFVTLFSMGAGVMYSIVILLLGTYDRLAYLHHPLGAIAVLVVVFVPSFFLGRWQLKKPPRRVPAE